MLGRIVLFFGTTGKKANSPQRQGGGNATGSLRNKVALPKGRSLMDWIRLGDSGVDLTGVGGKLIRVTPEELKKHNTKGDCWMALNGAVYNISQYCEFHPGGIDEIMKAAGKDGTLLFNEVHRWVNFESMLRKCLVGKLVSGDGVFKRPPQYGSLLAPPRAVGTSLQTVNRPQVQNSLATETDADVTDTTASGPLPFSNPINVNKPRYDYFQNDNAIKLCIYTRTAGVSSDNLVLERPDGNVKITLYLPNKQVFRLNFEPSHALLLDCKVKSTPTIGKLEIDFPKAERDLKWKKLGAFLEGHNTLLEYTIPEYIDCVISNVDRVTHDTKLVTLSLPEGYFMSVPTGHHVRLQGHVSSIEVVRSYTPVCHLNGEVADDSILLFLIKVYSDGALTPIIDRLNPGDVIPVSHPLGVFSIDQLEPFQTVLLLAAGTGFTPMTKIITHCIACKKKCQLVFFNKKEIDIMWRQHLEVLMSSTYGMFMVEHVLSNPDTGWTGHAGRITPELIKEALPAANKSNTFIAVCGPIPFNNACLSLLQLYGCRSEQFHIFQE